LRYLNTNEFNDLLMDLKMHYFMDIYFWLFLIGFFL